ncbi:hypothetical protein [Deinococcus aestuarii]|nr:hypothetical protein [Deinococcus aestuarii]
MFYTNRQDAALSFPTRQAAQVWIQEQGADPGMVQVRSLPEQEG